MTTEDNTVFDDKKETEPQLNQGGEDKVTLEDMVGPDKKYRSVDELAKGSKYADEYIEHLKQENKEMREELSKASNAEKVLEKLKSEQKDLEPRENTTPALTEDSIAALVKKQMDFNMKKEISDSNIKFVDTKIKELHGDKAKDFLADKAKQLNVSVDFLKSTAEVSPDAFFNLVGLDSNTKSEKSVGMTSPKVNTSTEGFGKSDNAEYGTKKYFDQIRAEKGNAFYFSPKIQNQIFEAKRNGKYDS